MYRVLNRITNTTMAVKICNKAKYKGVDFDPYDRLDGSEFSQALSELKVLEKMDHPHIVHVYEMLEDLDCFYVVMEEIQGGTLMQLLKQVRSDEAFL